jgi:hypothetical protein
VISFARSSIDLKSWSFHVAFLSFTRSRSISNSIGDARFTHGDPSDRMTHLHRLPDHVLDAVLEVSPADNDPAYLSIEGRRDVIPGRASDALSSVGFLHHDASEYRGRK